MLNYVVKTENDKQYRFGNQFNYAGTFFYWYETSKYAMVPKVGIAGEVYADNYQYKQKVRNTAGDIVFGKLVFEIGRDKFSFFCKCYVANKSKSHRRKCKSKL